GSTAAGVRARPTAKGESGRGVGVAPPRGREILVDTRPPAGMANTKPARVITSAARRLAYTGPMKASSGTATTTVHANPVPWVIDRARTFHASPCTVTAARCTPAFVTVHVRAQSSNALVTASRPGPGAPATGSPLLSNKTRKKTDRRGF